MHKIMKPEVCIVYHNIKPLLTIAIYIVFCVNSCASLLSWAKRLKVNI